MEYRSGNFRGRLGTRANAIMRLRWEETGKSGWVDIEQGIVHRQGSEERATNKRRGSCKATPRLHRLLRGWGRTGREFVIEWKGAPISDIGKALDGACERAGVQRITPHVLKHTAITWAFQKGMTMEDAEDYFDTSRETLRRVYRQHSPHHQARAVAVLQGRSRV